MCRIMGPGRIEKNGTYRDFIIEGPPISPDSICLDFVQVCQNMKIMMLLPQVAK
jgi:hypothetical protein